MMAPRRSAARSARLEASALGDAGCGSVFSAIDRGKCLPGKHQNSRFSLQLHDYTPGFDNFVSVGGTKHDEPRNGAQSDQMFDGLVGGAVFANADRIMRKDINHW